MGAVVFVCVRWLNSEAPQARARSRFNETAQGPALWLGQLAAAWALIGMGEARKAIPVLVALVKDQHSGLRSNALRGLRDLGLRARAAGPAVIEALKDQSVQTGAPRRLVDIGPWSDTVAVAITSALADEGASQDQDVEFRTAAISHWRDGSRREVHAVPVLTKLVEVDNGISASDAAKALGEIGPDAKPAVPALMRYLKDFAKDSTVDNSDDDG